MGMKELHKVLKVALWMYIIDFLYNLLSYYMGVPQSLRSQSLTSKGVCAILRYSEALQTKMTFLLVNQCDTNKRHFMLS